jgi:hypothetical protein
MVRLFSANTEKKGVVVLIVMIWRLYIRRIDFRVFGRYDRDGLDETDVRVRGWIQSCGWCACV